MLSSGHRLLAVWDPHCPLRDRRPVDVFEKMIGQYYLDCITSFLMMAHLVGGARLACLSRLSQAALPRSPQRSGSSSEPSVECLGSCCHVVGRQPTLCRCCHSQLGVASIVPSCTGHTNCKQQSKRNDPTHLKLSKLRARAVCKALIARGVDKSMLVAKGYGATRPLVDREGGAAENQRVEFTVIGS